jgi:cysteinyl-tRNA synthetase
MTYAEDTRVTWPDLAAKGYSAREIRLLLLQTHYRQPVRLNDQALEAARASLRRIDDCVRRLHELAAPSELPAAAARGAGGTTPVAGASSLPATPSADELEGWLAEARESFRRALFDDINVSAALAALFRLIRQVNPLANQARLCPEHARAVLETLGRMDHVLGLLPPVPSAEAALVPADVERLLALREQARQARDFGRADALRAEIAALGYLVEDRAEGPRLKSP